MMQRRTIHVGLVVLVVIWSSHVGAFDADTLPHIGYHPGGLAYWSVPYFCNALYNGHWLEYEPGQWGTDLTVWDNPQFNADGFPQYLHPGKRLRALCFGLHSNYASRPAAWPRRSRLAEGRVVLTWQGRADIRLNRGTFQAGDSSGPETGMLAQGRRAYLFENGRHLETLEIYALDPNDPITDIKVWLPDPQDPRHRALEGQRYHPLFLERLADADWGFIRFMDLLQTNANPQQDWSDRRSPSHCLMTGPLHPRAPAMGFPGQRGSGMAYEYMVSLCNQAHKDLWVCVPHLASDDFVGKLVQLIRYGSDGHEPYACPVPDPVYAPLADDLRVYVEYSNEIWSWGDSFAQGQWAYDQAVARGLSKARFNARRFCEIWRRFQVGLDNPARVVRVAAVFTADRNYTEPFLQEMATYGPSLDPPVEPDVVAVTTYFGNGIQDYVLAQARQQAGSEDPWFLRLDDDGQMRTYRSLPADDPYWTGEAFARHQEAVFAEWRRRLLSGDAREGAGPDAVGVGGGFDTWLADLARVTFPTPKPMVAYEGGPSLYTHDVDGAGADDDGITIFVEAMNRHPAFRDVYRIHLNMAAAKGLRTHVAFTDCGTWGKYGQWGHLETLDQDPNASVKYRFLLDWMHIMQTLRPVDDPCQAVPTFTTPHHLSIAQAGQPYQAAIRVRGGDGPLTLTEVGRYLTPALSVNLSPDEPNAVYVTGTPAASGDNYLYLRVTDQDGDPAWRTFTIKCVGGPDVLVESDFSGPDPALHLPWTQTYILAPALDSAAWDAGHGVERHAGDNRITWSVSAPAGEQDATLALAVQDEEYLALHLHPADGYPLDLRGARVHLVLRRIDYHAPRQYAVLTSVNHFDSAAPVFVSPRAASSDDLVYDFVLPDTDDYTGITDNLELRIYGFAGQYSGHQTALLEFQLKRRAQD